MNSRTSISEFSLHCAKTMDIQCLVKSCPVELTFETWIKHVQDAHDFQLTSTQSVRLVEQTDSADMPPLEPAEHVPICGLCQKSIATTPIEPATGTSTETTTSTKNTTTETSTETPCETSTASPTETSTETPSDASTATPTETSTETLCETTTQSSAGSAGTPGTEVDATAPDSTDDDWFETAKSDFEEALLNAEDDNAYGVSLRLYRKWSESPDLQREVLQAVKSLEEEEAAAKSGLTILEKRIASLPDAELRNVLKEFDTRIKRLEPGNPRRELPSHKFLLKVLCKGDECNRHNYKQSQIYLTQEGSDQLFDLLGQTGNRFCYKSKHYRSVTRVETIAWFLKELVANQEELVANQDQQSSA